MHSFNVLFLVFMKDVSHKTLGNLITYMYYGEVSVDAENLDEFISAAKSLKIKGLNDDSDSEAIYSAAPGASKISKHQLKRSTQATHSEVKSKRQKITLKPIRNQQKKRFIPIRSIVKNECPSENDDDNDEEQLIRMNTSGRNSSTQNHSKGNLKY